MTRESRYQSIRRAVLDDSNDEGCFDGASSCDQYLLELTRFSRLSKVPLQDIQVFANKIRRFRKEEPPKDTRSSASAGCDDTVAELKSEVKALKQKLFECNLNAMKQISALKSSSARDEEASVDSIEFYEPLRYLEQDVKELVMMLVHEKLRQLGNGTAPQSLLDAIFSLAGYSESPLTAQSFGSEESLRKGIMEAKSKLAAADSETRGEVKNIDGGLAERIVELEAALSDLRIRYEDLQEQASAQRSCTTRTLGLQTTGEDQSAEIRRLKLMLEELQQKVKELVHWSRKKGLGHEVMEIAYKVGLQPVIDGKSVFERLYDDAMDRVRRLEQIRDKVRIERERIYAQQWRNPPQSWRTPRPLGAFHSTSPRFDFASEHSVIDMLAQSNLHGLQHLAPSDDELHSPSAPEPQESFKPESSTRSFNRGVLPSVTGWSSAYPSSGKEGGSPNANHAGKRGSRWLATSSNS